ncbi:MAG: hypothetical protein E7170_03545 [Firmicutes bacterium]|nr:hypothetical protein [Bacillota bacterium]
MLKRQFNKKIIERKKVELLWNEYEMNLYTIANSLKCLNYYNVPQLTDFQTRIQALINDINIYLGLDDEQGDIIQTKYILTYEKLHS